MKTKRILFATFLMTFFCVAISCAQQGQQNQRGQRLQRPERTAQIPEVRTGNRAEMMKKMLDLTKEQEAKLQEAEKQLLEDMKQIRAKSEAIREEMKAKSDAFREEMKAKSDAYNAKMKSILTPEQYQKLQDRRNFPRNNSRLNMNKDLRNEFQRGSFRGRQWRNAPES